MTKFIKIVFKVLKTKFLKSKNSTGSMRNATVRNNSFCLKSSLSFYLKRKNKSSKEEYKKSARIRWKSLCHFWKNQ